MREVTIGVVQLENELFEKQANLQRACALIRIAAQAGAKIVCLPELFVTGYNLAVFEDKLFDMAETVSGQTISTIRELAKELGIYIIAPIAMRRENCDKLDNSAVFIDDNGEVVGIYNKNHLFGDEPKYFTTDGQYPVFETKYGKIGIMICCDNNFPEPARILALGGAEIIFLPAAWRVNEEDLWKLLISSHACENNVFIAASNTFCKMDGLFLFGHSKVVDPRGRVIEEITEEKQGAIVCTIDLDQINEMRNQMPSLKDRHPETYSIISASAK